MGIKIRKHLFQGDHVVVVRVDFTKDRRGRSRPALAVKAGPNAEHIIEADLVAVRGTGALSGSFLVPAKVGSKTTLNLKG